MKMNNTFQAKSASEKYIADYRIITELAASASSRVFLAESHTPGQPPVVVKLFYPTIIDAPYEFAHLLADMHSIHKLQHPNILPILDAGISIYTPYIVIPYIETDSLYERIQQHGTQPMPNEEALKILLHIGQALDYAHQQHIFYGKLKPRNVFFAQEDGSVQLADLTSLMLAKAANGSYLTNPDTKLYMAPEQFAGTPDALSDQYALGCLAYELFTMHKPFNPPFYAPQQREEPLKPQQLNPNLPSFIEHAILKAIAKEPAQRYPDILSFIHALTITPQIAATKITAETSSPHPRVNKIGTTRAQPQKIALGRKVTLLASCIILIMLIVWLLSSSLLLAHPSTYTASLLATQHTPTILPQSSTATKTIQPTHSTANAVKTPIVTPPTLTTHTAPTQSPTRPTPIPVAPTPTSSPIVITSDQLQISPTRFTTANCVLDNSNYRCTATLQLSNRLAGHLDWQLSTSGIITKLNSLTGTIHAGQNVQLVIYIQATCPRTGSLVFSAAGHAATATWSC
jgi:serine/threonine protein kinase